MRSPSLSDGADRGQVTVTSLRCITLAPSITQGATRNVALNKGSPWPHRKMAKLASA